MDPNDPQIQQAQQDVSDFLSGNPVGPKKATGADAQAIAQAAQAFLNANKPSSAESSTDKEARQLDVQNAREAWQATQNANTIQERQAIQDARDLTAKDIAAGRVQSASDVAKLRGQYQTDIAAGRNQTSIDVAGVKAGSAIDVAKIRAAMSAGNTAATVAGREAVAQIDVAGKLAEIQQQSQNDLNKVYQQYLDGAAQARQKYEQDKDLTAYNFALQDLRNAHQQEAMQIRQSMLEQQKQVYALPKQQSDIEVAQANAETERGRMVGEVQNQQQQRQDALTQMGLGAAQKQADMAQSAIDSGIKLGVAPPAALARMQFAPFAMAQDVLQKLSASGQIDPSKIPEGLGIKPISFTNTPSAAAPMPDSSQWNIFTSSLPTPNAAPTAPTPAAPPPQGAPPPVDPTNPQPLAVGSM